MGPGAYVVKAHQMKGVSIEEVDRDLQLADLANGRSRWHRNL